MFDFRRRKPQKISSVWANILGSLKTNLAYTDRLDAILTELNKIFSFHVDYLYFLDASGKRLSLEYMKFPSVEEESSGGNQELPIVTTSTDYESVHTILRTPLLDFPFTNKHHEIHTTMTRAGLMHSIPLQRDGRLVGVLQAGPLEDDQPVNDIKEKTDNLLFPLSFALTQARQEEQLHKRLLTMESRTEVSRRLLSSAFELNEFLSLLLDLALTATGTGAGFVAIADAKGEKPQGLTIRAQKNMPDAFLEDVNLEIGEGLFDWMSEESQTLIVSDYEFVQAMGVNSILAVPLMEGNDLLGLFVLVNFKKGETFAEYSLKLLTSFTEQIRLILDNVRLLDQFTQRYLVTMKALTKIVDLRNPATATHTERVTAAAVEIAKAMKMSAHEVNIIKMAAEIHDIGMCGLADTGTGYQADFDHPTIGADMIRVLALPAGVADAIAEHHEWFDGWGYPNGTKGNELSLGGRVLALAEYFVEATTAGELQQVPTWEKLKMEIQERNGTQFDPEVVSAFLTAMEKKCEKAGDGVLDGCTRFKACPAELQADCPARGDTAHCFRYQEKGVQCKGHGDETCGNCFLYLEFQERSKKK